MPNYNYNLNCTPPGSWTRIFRTAVAGEIAAGGLSRMTSILRHTLDGCEILHKLVTIGIKLCKEWDYTGINHLPTGDFFQGFWTLYPSSSGF